MFETLSFRYVGATTKVNLELLRTRYAVLRNVPADTVVLAPSPQAFAVFDLDPAGAEIIGPPDFPVSAIIMSKPDRKIEETLCDGLIFSALKMLERRALGAIQGGPKEKLFEIAEQLGAWPSVNSFEVSEQTIFLFLSEADGFQSRAMAIGLDIPIRGDVAEIEIRSQSQLSALMDRLLVPVGRVAEVERTTNETAIRVIVDLDRSGYVRAETGIGFYDHMLEQIAKHGGFSLTVECRGDLQIDGHHTIEDVALTLGEALNSALGDRRGISRFGFELPMDETRAGVWVDLSGRPFSKFEGRINGDRVGEFPVEMTSHFFKSLSETLKASIHISVEGENAHHMIEACFKAFGRALRQGLKIEGGDIPSTKGVL